MTGVATATLRSAGYDVGIFDQAIRGLRALRGARQLAQGCRVLAARRPFQPDPRGARPRSSGSGRTPACSASSLAALRSQRPCSRCTRSASAGWGRGSRLLATAAYVFWWPVQGLVAFDFHEIAFAVPLVAWLIDSLDRGRYRTVAEPLPRAPARAGGHGLRRSAWSRSSSPRSAEFRLAGALAVVGIAAFELITKVAIPGFSPNGPLGLLGLPPLAATPQSALAHIVAAPARHRPASSCRQSQKRVLLVCLFLPPTLLSLMSPYTLLALPILAERLLSSRPFLWTFNFQYNAILAPILVLATVDTLARLTAARRRPRAGDADARDRACSRSRSWAGRLSRATCTRCATSSPSQGWAETARTRAAAEIVARIPPRACVEADDRLIPHLIGRDYIVPPNGREDSANWLAVDTSQENTGGGARSRRRNGWPPRAVGGSARSGGAAPCGFSIARCLRAPSASTWTDEIESEPSLSESDARTSAAVELRTTTLAGATAAATGAVSSDCASGVRRSGAAAAAVTEMLSKGSIHAQGRHSQLATRRDDPLRTCPSGALHRDRRERLIEARPSPPPT